MDSRECWNEIVRLTDGPDQEFYQSLRVALFIWLQARDRTSLRIQGRQLLSAGRAVIPIIKGPLPVANKGRIVLCLPHRTPANVGNLLPVAREALTRGLLGGILASPDAVEELGEFEGRVPIVSSLDLLWAVGTWDRWKLTAEAVSCFRALGRVLSSHDSVLGLGFRRHAGTLLAETIWSAQMARGTRLLLQSWAPSVVASTSDFWPLEFQFIRQASRLNIPSAVVQHGMADDSWWPFQADVFIAWGEIFRDKMEGLGTPPQRLAVGGMPGVDGIFRRVAQEASHASQARSSQQRPVCLILSHSQGRSVEPEIFDRYREELSAVVTSAKSIRFIVKLHPSEDDTYYRELPQDVRGRIEIYPQSTSLVDAVRDSDIVTTLFSTAGLEAMMMNRPVLVPAVTHRIKQLAWWPALGGGVYTEGVADFLRSVERLSLDPGIRIRQLEAQRVFIRRSFANPGESGGAIVDLLSNTSLMTQAMSHSASSTGATRNEILSRHVNHVSQS